MQRWLLQPCSDRETAGLSWPGWSRITDPARIDLCQPLLCAGMRVSAAAAALALHAGLQRNFLAVHAHCSIITSSSLHRPCTTLSLNVQLSPSTPRRHPASMPHTTGISLRLPHGQQRTPLIPPPSARPSNRCSLPPRRRRRLGRRGLPSVRRTRRTRRRRRRRRRRVGHRLRPPARAAAGPGLVLLGSPRRAPRLHPDVSD